METPPQKPRLSNQIAKIIIAKWQVFFAQLPKPYSSLSLGTYAVRWNPRMRSRAGLCSPGDSQIELNPHILIAEKDFESTLVHELCHLAVSRRWPTSDAHGAKWKSLMEICGFKPERCHRLAVPQTHSHKKWEYLCGCQTHMVSTRLHNKLSKGYRYKCLACGGKLKSKTAKPSPSLVSKIRDLLF